jgi:2'-5' RNA ligase
MRRKIFIAINLPENIKRKLAEYESKWPGLPARWTKINNIHITLVFLGYLDDEELVEVCKITKEVASRNSPFQVVLNKICYGPPRPHTKREQLVIDEQVGEASSRYGVGARMVWAVGEKSEEFSALREDLNKSFLQSEKIRFSSEERAFCPHITLARISQWEWRKVEPEERPEINEDISLVFGVSSIEIMESELKRGGAKYTILESHNLEKEIFTPTP